MSTIEEFNKLLDEYPEYLHEVTEAVMLLNGYHLAPARPPVIEFMENWRRKDDC